MNKLVELSSSAHRDLKVIKGAAMEAAKHQHIINVYINEAPITCTTLPMFLLQVPDSDRWAISSITALETGNNLYIKDGKWDGTYQPTALLTFPMTAMAVTDENEKRRYTVGINEESSAFSKTEGQALFEEDGKATPYLSQIAKLIETSMQNEVHTLKFCNKLRDLGLITPAAIKVAYANGSVNTLNGLHTIDEKKLQALDIKELDELRKQSYLPAIYSILASSFQLNLLMQKHNSIEGNNVVAAINMETGEPAADDDAKAAQQPEAKTADKNEAKKTASKKKTTKKSDNKAAKKDSA